MKNRLQGALLTLSFAAGLTVPAAGRAIARLGSVVAAAVADPSRPAADRETDVLRKPAETLLFAGVRSGFVVGEFYPSGGYYTRMLSDVVGPAGHVYGIENEGWKGNLQLDQSILKDLHSQNVSFENLPFGTVRFPRPLDLAWVTQNYHDLKVPEFGNVDTVAFDREVYRALKPGGIFFVLDHEGAPGLADADIAKVHRIDRDEVVREVTSAGFKLAAEGNFLRRPGDDHSLPIFDKAVKGHTDQFALKFIKPRA